MTIALVGDNNNGFFLEMFILQNRVQHVHVFAMYSFILVTAAMDVVWISMLVIAVTVSMVVAAMVSTVMGVVAMVTTCMGAILAIFLGAIRFTTVFIISVLHLQRYILHLTDLVWGWDSFIYVYRTIWWITKFSSIIHYNILRTGTKELWWLHYWMVFSFYGYVGKYFGKCCIYISPHDERRSPCHNGYRTGCEHHWHSERCWHHDGCHSCHRDGHCKKPNQFLLFYSQNSFLVQILITTRYFQNTCNDFNGE